MRSRVVAVVAVLCLFSLLAHAQAATAAPTWTPADQATIRPGVPTITAGQSQCTSNFVFHDGADVYIGQAAHCSIAGDALTGDPLTDPLAPTPPQGCAPASLPLGTPVQIAGATKPGKLVYNSWITMREVGETDSNACTFNDFALIKLDPADIGRANPTMPHWGGPTGLAGSTEPGEKVVSYGSSELRFGLGDLSPKEGISRGQSMERWNHTVVTLTPGIPGDSGSGFLDSEGRAFGVLSTLILIPQPVHNGVGDLTRQLRYMRAHTDLDRVVLATGTEPFNGSSPSDAALPLLDPTLDLLEVPLGLLQGLGF